MERNDPNIINLSHMRCDLRGLGATEAAAKFHVFLCSVADEIGVARPTLHRPGSREEAGNCWWVVWEAGFPDWGVTGGGWVEGELAGWEPMRNGVHFRNPKLGPFFAQDNKHWYLQPYYGRDVIFQTCDPAMHVVR